MMEIIVGYLIISFLLSLRELMMCITFYFKAKNLIKQGVLSEYFQSNLIVYNYKRVLLWPYELITRPANFFCEIFLGMKDFQLRAILCEKSWFQTYIVGLKRSDYYQFQVYIAEITNPAPVNVESCDLGMKYILFYAIKQRETGDIICHSHLCQTSSLSIVNKIDIPRKNFTEHYIIAKKYKHQDLNTTINQLKAYTDKALIIYNDVFILD